MNIRTLAARFFASALLAAPFVACAPATEAQTAPAPAPAEAPEPETTQSSESSYVDTSPAGVAERHFKTLVEGDLDGMMVDYADSAFILTPDGALKGKDAIREHYAALLKELAGEGAAFNRGDVRVNREVAYITWKADTPVNKYEIATDTLVIRNGKIVGQSFAALVTAKSESDEEAPEAEPAPLAETPTATLLKHRVEALKSTEIEDVMSDYTKMHSIILTQTGKKSDIQTIEIFSNEILDHMKEAKPEFEPKTMLVQGDVGFIFWAAQKGDSSEFIADTIVVRDKKIGFQTVTFSSKR